MAMIQKALRKPVSTYEGHLLPAAGGGLAFLALLFFFPWGSAQGQPTDTTRYQIGAEIDPPSGRIEATVGIHFVPEAPTDTLRFLLHDDLSIRSLDGPLADGYETTPWRYGGRDTLHTRVVTVPLARRAGPSDPVSLSWSYEGRLQNEHLTIGGAVQTARWTELPVEAMWVPVSASLRQRFVFEASIQVPDGYEVVSTGRIRPDGNRWTIPSQTPGPDVPLIISDRLRKATREGKGVSIAVYHAGAPDSTLRFVADRTARIAERYARRFGAAPVAETLRVALSPVERADPTSNYARPGLISLRRGIEPDAGLHSTLAHEAAHLWWSDAESPLSRHNFLNESFAEYESWRALRAAGYEAAFQRRLEKAREKAEGAPSFYDWTAGADGALSYNKGPLLLRRLRARVGKESYLQFLRRLQKREVGTLEGMIEILKTTIDPETARWFDDRL